VFGGKNVIKSLQVAQKCSASELLEASFEYLSRHKEEIVHLPEWKQFNKEDPELFFTATQRMCSKKRKLEHESVPKFSVIQPASLTERARPRP
jgi:hypothetical protein